MSIRNALIFPILVSCAPAVCAQGLDEAAARARAQALQGGARATTRVYTDEDLRRYHPASPGDERPTAGEGQATLASLCAAEESAAECEASALRRAAHARRLASAEAYLRQSESKFQAAAQSWQSVASGEDERRQLGPARRRLELLGQALARAQDYRDRAAQAARRAGLPLDPAF